jgi:hypothetical protein
MFPLKTHKAPPLKLEFFWQYPVITEKTFYEQNMQISNYIGFPWATLHDKYLINYPVESMNYTYKLLKSHFPTHTSYYTCCQHIAFRKFFALYKALNITTVYSPHKIIGENKIDNISIISCPLYAVNIEDITKNQIFNGVDFLNCERKYLYSFMGGYQQAGYISDIRPRIFNMKHPKNTFIKNTGTWHFDNIVFTEKQNKEGTLNQDDKHIAKTNLYNQVLLDSRYSLCPSGSGPNSIRFWESLAIGSIPILLSDFLDLPKHELWKNAILRVKEAEIETIPTILSVISQEKEREMRENCLKIYKDLKDNYKNE